jgi:hypothetical protein
VAGEANQAAYTQDMLTTWRTIGYTGPAFVYTLQDTAAAGTDSATPEDSLGLIRKDGTWKPAAYVVRALTTLPAAAPTEMPVTAAAQTPVIQTPVIQTPVLQTPKLATAELAPQTASAAVTQDVARVSAPEAAPAADTPSSDTPKKPSAETPKKKPSADAPKRSADEPKKPRADRHR